MDAKMDSELDTTGTDDNELSTEGALALAPVAVAQDAEVVTREQRRSRAAEDAGGVRERRAPVPLRECKHHLYLDVNDRTGSIKLNFPDLEVWEMPRPAPSTSPTAAASPSKRWARS
jgi:hypothetical protein